MLHIMTLTLLYIALPHPRNYSPSTAPVPPEFALYRPPRMAILYASLTSPNFRDLHTFL